MKNDADLTPHDWDRLTDYVDAHLSADEKNKLEAEMLSRPELRQALEDLKFIRKQMRIMPRLRVPHNFTISAKTIQKRHKTGWGFWLFSFASTVSAVALVLTFFIENLIIGMPALPNEQVFAVPAVEQRPIATSPARIMDSPSSQPSLEVTILPSQTVRSKDNLASPAPIFPEGKFGGGGLDIPPGGEPPTPEEYLTAPEQSPIPQTQMADSAPSLGILATSSPKISAELTKTPQTTCTLPAAMTKKDTLTAPIFPQTHGLLETEKSGPPPTKTVPSSQSERGKSPTQTTTATSATALAAQPVETKTAYTQSATALSLPRPGNVYNRSNIIWASRVFFLFLTICTAGLAAFLFFRK